MPLDPRPVRIHAGVLDGADRAPGGSNASITRGRRVGCGKLLGLWYSFGDCDGYWLGEFPDNASATAVAISVAGSGALRLNEVTVLVTVDEMLEALAKAKAVKYRAPGPA